MTSIVNNILPINASLILFEYKFRIFDEDYSVKIKCNDNNYFFETFKGYIFYNKKTILQQFLSLLRKIQHIFQTT